MSTRRRLFALIATVLAYGVGPLHAEDLTREEEALKLIREAVPDFCTPLSIEQSHENVELNGNAKAKLDGVLSKVANIGVEGAAKYDSGESKGVLQQDLAAAIKNGNDCRLAVLNTLIGRLLPNNQGASTQSNPQSPQHPNYDEPRVFTTKTIDEIHGFYKNRTDLQGNAFMADELGKWITTEGKVQRIRADGLVWLADTSGTIMCKFDESWREKLTTFSSGQPMKVEGKIMEQQLSGPDILNLEPCELRD